MVQQRTHEQTINTALGEILHDLGHVWIVRSENIGGILEEGGRPDILIEKFAGWPIVLEAEVGDHREAEADARARLGNRLVESSSTIDSAVAIVYPEELRGHGGEDLRNALRVVDLDYVMLRMTSESIGMSLRLCAKPFCLQMSGH